MNGESTIERPMQRSEAVAVFAEMFDLLEEYAPVWYSEEMHKRAEAALRFFESAKEG